MGRGSRRGCAREVHDDLVSEEGRSAAAIPRVGSPWNLFITGGDWSVAAVVDRERVVEFEGICEQHVLDWRPLGWVTADAGALNAVLNHRDYSVTPIRNENFLDRGFNSGLQGHLDYVLSTPVLTRGPSP